MPKRKAAQQTAAVAAAPAAPDYSKMTVAELKAELTKQKLSTAGKKAELVDRLTTASSGASASSSSEPPAKKAKKDTKKAKAEPEPEPESAFSKAVATLKSVPDGAAAKKKKTRTPKVDSHVPGAGRYAVEQDYDCMLNQTNIGHNNNKYYVIQLLKATGFGTVYSVWTRWGRVGESGQNKMIHCGGSLENAEAEFKKKFQSKTLNAWDKRDKFVPKSGKYTLLEMEDDDEDDQAGRLASLDEPDGPAKKIAACKLDSPTQQLVKLIFDEDMFKEAMASLEIDTKKLPLGKLSKIQVKKGFEVLEKIEKKLNKEPVSESLQVLCSQFYTLIPHDFGRQRPPLINDKEVLQKKKDMLLVLADIEMAQTLQAQAKDIKPEVDELPHPLDEKYEKLMARLSSLPKSSSTFKVIDTYLQRTQGAYRKLQIMDVFEVDRSGEGDRFAAHDGLDNRRLLWHGTNVAVVAAILKTGLRIMPHSGGRVGRGMYFASENGKSANYVRTARGIGIMFLVEVALGKEHHIGRDDWTLTKAPSGFDCIVAKGRTEPDPTLDTKLEFDGKEVAVPQGTPLQQGKWSQSSFSQSEYLVYKESQARIRYLLKLKF